MIVARHLVVAAGYREALKTNFGDASAPNSPLRDSIAGRAAEPSSNPNPDTEGLRPSAAGLAPADGAARGVLSSPLDHPQSLALDRAVSAS